jgi:hypothetical protein
VDARYRRIRRLFHRLFEHHRQPSILPHCRSRRVCCMALLILSERVTSAFVKDFPSVVCLFGLSEHGTAVREPQIVQQSYQVVRVEFDIEIGVYDMLYPLFFPRSTLFEQVKRTLLLLLIELHGQTAQSSVLGIQHRLCSRVRPIDCLLIGTFRHRRLHFLALHPCTTV